MAGQLGQRHASGLGHEGHGAGCPWIGFNDEHCLGAIVAALHGELQIDQAAHLQGLGQLATPATNRGQGRRAQTHRWQAAGGVARVHSRRLDVFHQPADHHLTIDVAERIHIHLCGVFQVLVDQYWVVWFHVHRLQHVAVQFGFVEHHLHRPAAEYVAGTHHHRIAHLGCHLPGLGLAAGQAVARLADLQAAQDRFELLAILGAVDRFRGCAPDLGASGQPLGRLQPAQQRDGQFERCLTAELHDHPCGFLGLDHIQHVFEGERFEIETVAGVVVGGDRLWVAVYHHSCKTLLLQGKRGVATAVIEFDPLADAVGATAQDHHLGARFGLHFVFRWHQL